MAELYVNVNGTWKQATNYYVNVNGYWKEGSELHAKVSSAWKQSGSAVYSGTSGIVTTNIVLDLNATLTNSYSGSGTTWTDLSGEGNNATLVNGPSYNSSHGGYFSFDGSNDHATLPEIDISGDEVTFTVWNYGISNQYSFLLYLAGDSANNRVLSVSLPYPYPTNTNQIYFDKGNTTSYDRINFGATNSEYQGWHHWAFTANASTGSMKIYLDGVLRHSGTGKNTQLASPSTGIQAIGGQYNNMYHIGYISQILLYKKELTAAEVLANYNATKSNYTDLITTDLVLYLDASNFDSYTGSGTTWSDISGNNNDLTLTNGPTFNSQDGGVIVFDGTNDFAISALNQAFFQFGTGDYSYGLWVKLDTQGSSSYAAVLSSGGGSETGSWQIDLYLTNKYRHRFKNSSDTDELSTTTLSNFTNNWIYLFVVNDRSEDELKIYVNGTLNATGSSTNYGSINVGNFSSATDVKNVFNVAQNRNQDSFIDGSVGQVHVYKGKALSATEVLQNYNATKGNFLGAISTTDLVFYLDASKSMSYSGSGTTWTDLSSSSKNGTLTNGPTFDSDFGGSIVFDGTNDRVEIGSNMFNPNSDFTFTAWINLDATSGNYTIVSDYTNVGKFQLRYKNGFGLQILDSTTLNLGAFSYSETLATGTWYNITVSRSSNTYTYYLNGSQVSSLTSSNTYEGGPQTLGANHFGTSEYFDGKIAQVFAYDEALTASVILSNYNATKSSYHELITTNLVLHLDASNSSSYSGSGTTWSNLASSSLNATLVNGVTFSSDNGGTFVFDGTNDYAEITSASALGGFSGDFTIEFWYKAPDQDAYHTLFDFNGESNATVFRWAVQAAVGASNMTLRRDSAFAITTSGIDPFDDNWHHHVIARNGSTITYYIDNVSRGTETYSGSISSGTNLIIGRYSIGGYHIGGSLPQVRIYDGTGFTASQVLQNYNATKSQYLGLITTNLVLHLDASNSSSYSGTGTTWTDLSGNSNNGTLTNGPTYSSDNGGAIVFDGSDDYVSLGTSINSDISVNKDCSFNIWIQFDIDSRDNLIISHPSIGTANDRLILWYDKSAFSTPNNTGSNDVGGGTTNVLAVSIKNTVGTEYRWNTGNNVFGNSVTGTWHNICLVFDTTNDKYYTYLNGQQVALFNSTAVQGIDSDSQDFHIGRSTASHGSWLDGKVSRFLVYNIALTANQVLQNYNATKATYGY